MEYITINVSEFYRNPDQWAYMDKFKEAGITGLLGTGFEIKLTKESYSYDTKKVIDKNSNINGIINNDKLL